MAAELQSTEEGVTGDIAQPVVHPLTIPYVLERVLQYCTYKDLQSARSVNRQWYSQSFKTFASRSRLHFRNYKELNLFMAETSTANLPAGDSSEDQDQSPDLPPNTHYLSPELCTHVRLSGLEFQSLTMLLRPFLNRFSSTLSTFEIDHGHVSHCPSGIEVFLRELALNVPNLESLILYGSHLSYQPREPVNHFSIALPSVKTLKLVLGTLSTSPRNGYHFFSEVLRALPNLENIICINYPFLSLYTLERIDFPKNLSSLHLHIWNGFGLHEFVNQGLRVKNLMLNIEVSLSLVNLHSLIQSVSHTLESLHLNFTTVEGQAVYNYSHNATSFPSAPGLTSLKHLKLVGFWGNLYFLKEIPKLERASIECMQWKIAFPKGVNNDDLLPAKVRKIIRFFDENRVYHEI